MPVGHQGGMVDEVDVEKYPASFSEQWCLAKKKLQ
jgi:hypothetical protein